MDNPTEVRDFLSTRRARLTPEHVGLPLSGRRRVQGLRRNEVAALAGVSVEYYARMERGSLRGVSAGVLDAIARALRLDDSERAHLLRLAQEANGSNAVLRAGRRARPADMRPSLQWNLDSFASPATIIDSRTDLVGVNHLGRALFSDAFADPAATPNFARYVFTDGGARRFFLYWEQVADVTMGNLRICSSRDPHDTGLSTLITELSATSSEFRRRWKSHGVDPHDTGVVDIHHHVVGHLTLTWESLDLRADARLTMNLYTAEPGSPSADALDLLASLAASDHA
ncbi:helix-turn-helix domain-containing protein [Lentzea sp. NPDC059081]|uniref:helix-turn-helix domain-containing protein n=1 Tax=Lentzea sp. NPDC059081 TaxID=3346719 RepID=UPI0036A1EEC4